MKQPIRWQLLKPLLSVLTAAVLGIAVCAAWLNWSRQQSLLQQRQNEVLRVLEAATFPLTAAVLQQMSQLSGDQFVVWDPETRRILETSLPGDWNQLTRQLEQALAENPAVARLAWNGDHYSLRRGRPSRAPGSLVLVLTSQRTLDDARWDAVMPPLALGGGALLLLVPWLLALTRNWSRRIEQIQRAVAGIAAGQMTDAPQPPGHDDELSALMHDIHRMSQRLQELQQELVQSERERLVALLAAGFAHQFRNGVAGASLALQLHASRCPVATERSLAVAQKQLGLLEMEVRGILSLARRGDEVRDWFSISDLFADAIELVLPALEHHSIDFENRTAEQHPLIQGSQAKLRAALLNLLQNAIDACGPGGRIAVEAEPVAGQWVLRVCDNGPGPRPDVAAYMTEAFVTTKPEGLGLGLTVAAAVVQDHGGELQWRRDAGWTMIELKLPRTDRKTPASDESRTDCG